MALNRLARRMSTLLPKVRRHGIAKVIFSSLLKRLDSRLRFKVLRCHHLALGVADFLAVPPGYAAAFVADSAVRKSMRDGRFEASEQFVGEALAKGDKCYGLSQDDALSAYSWYATTPTRALPGLRVHFSRDYVYMYKAFTHEPHRGRRLYAVGVTRALRHYRSIGYKGVLAYVDASNLDSLKSCARMGFKPFGSIYVLEAFGRYHVYASPGCARFGLYVADSLESGHAGLRSSAPLRARGP